ncbi:MAG: NUDIX hydrolase [Anaerolineae bacterium]|nr:MAG: NUDIX hydrolase [Anaerolineae bacterium]
MTNQPHELHKVAWETLSRTDVFDASPWLHVYREHVRMPNGVEIPDFYHIHMDDYTMTFALTDDEHVAMVEMYKQGTRQVMLELPAGAIEHDEITNVLEAAKRELLEETGMVARHWQPLGKFSMDSNHGCGWMHAFLATGAVRQQGQTLDETELLAAHLIPLEEVRQMWMSGKINGVSSAALIGLALAHLEKMKSDQP